VPLRQSEAIVIDSRPLQESDRIVTFLTRSDGKVRTVAKGARRSRKRFGANLMLLSRVHLSWFEKEGRDLARLESADLLESFYDLQADPERGAVLACCAEVTDAIAREQQEDEAFFRLLAAVLQAVRQGVDLDRALRYFEIWTLRLHGVLPDLAACGRCGTPLAAHGGTLVRRDGIVTCSRCAERRAGDPRLRPEASDLAAEFMKRPPSTLGEIATTPQALESLGEIAAALLFDLTERRFRSYEILARMRRP
jgi:DNA repair protein RecO (recombination protein O)